MRSVGIFVLCVLSAVVGAPAQSTTSAPAVGLAVEARTLQPGEVVVVSLDIDPAATDVRVTGFGQEMSAFHVEGTRWQALLGIDLDQAPGPYRLAAEARLRGQTIAGEAPVLVQPKVFPTRTLKVAPAFVNPPPAVMARIGSETAFLSDVFAASARERLWRDSFVRPVPHRANSRFGSRSIFNGESRNPHSGTDFLSPAGTPIKAPNAGRVVGARDLYFSGKTVIVDHGLGVFSLLAHLSRLDVKESDRVERGEVVGAVGATGRVTGAHLHWSLRIGDARVDPLGVLALLGANEPERVDSPARR